MKISIIASALAATVSANTSQMSKDLDALFAQYANVTVFKALNPTDFGLIQMYGCWCRFDHAPDTTHVHGRGPPVDELDKFCKTLNNGYECAIIDHAPNDVDGFPVPEETTCIPWLVNYNSAFGFSIPGSLTIENVMTRCDENNVDSCSRDACKAEGWMVQEYFAFAVTGGLIDPVYTADGGFDNYDSNSCPTVPHTGEFPHRKCCGTQPERFPFKYGDGIDRECCGTKTYSPSLYSCCDDGKARIECEA